jgi:hypothetical protein
MISTSQKKVIFFSKNLVKKKNYSHSIFSYFAIFEKNPGSFLIKAIIKKRNYFFLIFSSLKHIYGIVNTKLKVINCLDLNQSYKNVIVTWAFKNNFKKNGIFFDKYLKKSSIESNDVIWLLIYMDKKLPDKIGKNILLVQHKKNFFKGIYFFFKYFFECLKNNFFKGNFFGRFNSFFSFSNELIKIYENNVNLEKIKNFLVVYEGQIFQKELIKFNRNNFKDIKNIAYDHSAPPPLPLNLIYDKFSPDFLYVTGGAQEKFYSKNLLWPKNKIKITKPLRFKGEKKSNYTNKLFLPYELYDERIYLKNLILLLNHEKLNIKDYHIKLHPLRFEKKSHVTFLNQIKKINNKNFKKKSFANSVFFGQTTAVIIALEFGITCYHVCTESEFDSYSKNFWPDINIQQLNQNVFKYRLKKRGAFLNFSSKQDFSKLC